MLTQNYNVPLNDASDRVVIPETLAEIYKAGVDAEIMNIEMYKSFLEEDLPDDIKFVFERLKSASEKHLSAFERSADRSTGFANGKVSENNRNKQGEFGGNFRIMNAQGSMNNWSNGN